MNENSIIVDHKEEKHIYYYLVSFDGSCYGDEWMNVYELGNNYIYLIDNYFDKLELDNELLYD